MEENILKSRHYWAVVAATVIALGVMWWSCTRGGDLRYRSDIGVIWTTGYHITYESRHPMTDSILAALDSVDRSANMYNRSSLLRAINENRTDSVDRIIMRLYECARGVYEQSGHLYDPTVKPLVALWGFTGDSVSNAPSRAAMDSVRRFVGLDKTHIEDGHLIKDDPRVQLDFSSIAKGLACDMVGEMLARNGITNYLVEIGGEVVCAGVNPGGTLWTVNIQDPASAVGEVGGDTINVQLTAGAIATSGTYRKNASMDGCRVSHIVNPVTGEATVSDLVSATVVAHTCMSADAWATAIMAMGYDTTREQLEGEYTIGYLTMREGNDGAFTRDVNPTFLNLTHLQPAPTIHIHP